MILRSRWTWQKWVDESDRINKAGEKTLQLCDAVCSKGSDSEDSWEAIIFHIASVLSFLIIQNHLHTSVDCFTCFILMFLPNFETFKLSHHYYIIMLSDVTYSQQPILGVDETYSESSSLHRLNV